MPEELLHRAQRDSTRGEFRRERVPQSMPGYRRNPGAVTNAMEIGQGGRRNDEVSVAKREDIRVVPLEASQCLDHRRRQGDVTRAARLGRADMTQDDGPSNVHERLFGVELQVVPRDAGGLSESDAGMQHEEDEDLPKARTSCSEKLGSLFRRQVLVPLRGYAQPVKRGHRPSQGPLFRRRQTAAQHAQDVVDAFWSKSMGI